MLPPFVIELHWRMKGKGREGEITKVSLVIARYGITERYATNSAILAIATVHSQTCKGTPGWRRVT